MNVQSIPASVPQLGGATAPARTPEQQAQAKAQKKEKKQARMRFFLAWCEGCQAFGTSF